MTVSWMPSVGLPVRIVHFVVTPNPGNGQLRAPAQTSRQMGELARQS